MTKTRYITMDGLRVAVGSPFYKWLVKEKDKMRGRVLNATPAKRSIRKQALANLTGKLGTKENPPGSNKCWASIWYGMIGPWCAMSASWAYATAGSKRFVRGQRYAYVPFIVNDARAKRNGLSVTTAPIPGDLVCYDWDGGVADHVGIFEKWAVRGKSFYAVEGNTSKAGSQSNGGEVCRQLRPVGLVQAFVRVSG